MKNEDTKNEFGTISPIHKSYIRSLNQKHSTLFLNTMFSLKRYSYNTRKSKYTSFVTHCCKNNTKANSLTNRGSKLLNLLNENNLLPQNIEKMTKNEVIIFIHNFRDSFILILGNCDLTKYIFN